MCRKNIPLGVGLIALGLGILLGFCVGSWFWCACSALALVGLGFFILRRK